MSMPEYGSTTQWNLLFCMMSLREHSSSAAKDVVPSAMTANAINILMSQSMKFWIEALMQTQAPTIEQSSKHELLSSHLAIHSHNAQVACLRLYGVWGACIC